MNRSVALEQAIPSSPRVKDQRRGRRRYSKAQGDCPPKILDLPREAA
jgi:hypothetical protein